MGVQADGAALAGLAPQAAAHHQVGDRFQAGRTHGGVGHGMHLSGVAEALQQLGGAQRMRRVVAGRGVGGHLHQLLQEGHLLIEVGIDPGIQCGIGGGLGGGCGHE